MSNISKFSEKRTALKQVIIKVKYYLLRKLLKNAPTLFMNPADIITRFTLAYEIHEKVIFKLISFIAKEGYSDFFIDIGANIGLTSVQSEGKFKKYFLVEPNPILYNVLIANLNIKLSHKSFKVYNYGLSDIEGEDTLMIPRDNWGGAFVLKGNDYDVTTLLYKDGKKALDAKNYIKQKIRLKKSEDFINEVIYELKSNSLNKGIIKIDVEGYEKKILKSILPILQKNKISCYIIFEQWDKEWNSKELDDLLNEGNLMWKIDEKDPDIKTFSGLITILKSLIFGKIIINKVHRIKGSSVVGNILIKLNY